MYRLQAAQRLIKLPSSVTEGMDEQQAQDFIMGALNMLHARAKYDGSKQARWTLDTLIEYARGLNLG
jgi:hypothetical protein